MPGYGIRHHRAGPQVPLVEFLAVLHVDVSDRDAMFARRGLVARPFGICWGGVKHDPRGFSPGTDSSNAARGDRHEILVLRDFVWVTE